MTLCGLGLEFGLGLGLLSDLDDLNKNSQIAQVITSRMCATFTPTIRGSQNAKWVTYMSFSKV